VNDLARYIEEIVEPTFEDFNRNRKSVRHAFLACVAIYHAVDRAAYPKHPGNLRRAWGKTLEFKLVDIVAHHFKHVKSDDEKVQPRVGIPLVSVLGFNDTGDQMELRNMFFVIRDAIKFLHQQAASRGQIPARPPRAGK